MDTKKLFVELEQNFGLRKNHILILDALTKDDYTAEALVKDTGIPMGRIYEFLNDLLEMKLIEKKPGYPAGYTIGDLNQRVLDFARHQTDVVIAKEQKLVSLIETEKETEQTNYISGKEELAYETIRLYTKGRTIKSITKRETVADILYPLDRDRFIKLRNYFGKKTKERGAIFKGGADKMRTMLFDTTKDAIISGKKISYIMDRHSIDHYLNLVYQLGEKEAKEILDTAKAQLKKYPNVKLRIIDEDLPLSIVLIDDRTVFLRFVHLDAPVGIRIDSKKVTNFYSQFFDELFSRAKPVEPYLKFRPQ